MKTQELKSIEAPALKVKLNELLREQFNLRVQKRTGQFKKTHIFKDNRRTIARIKTFLHEKEGA